MGIPSYFAYIVRKHRQIIRPVKINDGAAHGSSVSSSDNPSINNLYLDCNSFIYEAFNTLNSSFPIKEKNEKNVEAFEVKMIAYVCDSLIKYINLLKPNKRLYIAFDGVAPMAKLNQQRNRRYMTAYQSKLDQELDYKWNTSAITPGTEFMKKLGTLIKARFSNNAKEFGLETIIVSASDECGEGEHKIYQYIRDNATYHKDTKTVIYGLDADLIMLTLNHLHISENMFLFRETPEFIKSLDKTLNPNELYLLDIPLFARTIIQELSIEDSALDVKSISLKNDTLFDYIFMCFFLGNDFLPHFPSLNIRTTGINRLIDAYKNVFIKKGDTLTKDREIVWKNVYKFIEYLAKNELPNIKEEYALRDKLSKRTIADDDGKVRNGVEFDDTLLLPIKERSVEVYINPEERGWEMRYYKALFNKRVDDDLRKAISTNYLEGLEWTLKYYSSGCADWRWSYNYYYPPLLVDLIKYVPFATNSYTFVSQKPEDPVLPLVQLSYVLPPTSMDLLPLSVKVKLLKEKPDWYIGNYNFLWSFCKFFWEAHVDLPDIDIRELEELLS
jgi:5'-3' exoribonuclease 1